MFRRCFDPVVSKYQSVKKYMQVKKCLLSEEDLTEYQSFTFLSKPQVRKVYFLFESLDPENEPFKSGRNPSLLHEQVLQHSLLRLNPFKDRIVKVFSGTDDLMYFEEFLEMMSVFSDRAEDRVKAEYAFRIYDFDEDEMIGREDIREILMRLQGQNRLTAIDLEEIIENVMAETDIDADGFITINEFKHMITKCPDFLHSFKIRI